MTSPDRPPASPAVPAPAPDPQRVEDLLARVRAGVRQRQAELATLSGGEEMKLRLLELKTLEYVEEPVAFSPRPVIGRLLVLLRKAVFHFFVKWTARPVRERQNRFNQVASQLIHEMAGREARLAEALERALARIDALEERVEGGAAAEAEERAAAAGGESGGR